MQTENQPLTKSDTAKIPNLIRGIYKISILQNTSYLACGNIPQ